MRTPRTRRPARTPHRPPSALFVLAGLVAWVVASLPAGAQSNDQCLGCHDVEGLEMQREGRKVSLQVDPDGFKKSVHGKLDCVACHAELAGAEKFPHKKGLSRVSCTDCHDDENGPVAAWRASTHGQQAEKGNKLAPLCQDCHGDHYVLKLKDPNSSISPFNVPRMCAQCHTEGSPVERAYDIPQEQVFERYKDSIHGAGLFQKGLTVTAVCTSCHTGHNVRPHTDPASTIHKDRVPSTCMKCHGRIEDVHRKIIAGKLWEEQGVVPLCVECHSPHEIRKVFYDTNMSNADCLRCHSQAPVSSKDGRSLHVDAAEHERSIHGRKSVACAQCHTGATPSLERSCATITEKANCSICHEAQVGDYNRGRHGALHASGDKNAPTCVDCHGTHGILEHSVPEGASAEIQSLVRTSPTFTRNVPTLCARCHRDGAQAAVRYLGPETDIVGKYTVSIHGRGLQESGLVVTAVCSDCHTAHKELPAADPESSVNEERLPHTCGKCHDGIFERFETSIHSRTGNPEFKPSREMPKLPSCNDCHSSHGMARTDSKVFQLGIMESCGSCHQDITETYFETYHGKASSLGDAGKAKCYDCHGAHDIRPHKDPQSHISPQNIVATCGTCHAGSHERFAGYLTHATHQDKERYPALYWTFVAMTALLLGVFVFFGMHTLAWLPLSWKMRGHYRKTVAAAAGEALHFQRFTRFQRALHLTVILSFFGLAITGMMLKFSYTGWAHALSRFLGGIEGAGWIHRVCAVATFGYMVGHAIDVGRRFLRSGKSLRQFLFGPDSLVPKWGDVKELFATLRWFFGRGPAPRYGRWTYWEKFDYFAVFWGVVIIGSTGLCLWFPVQFTHFMPGWAINVATIIHSDEALLATGFIFTIHFFNTHFRPEKFPMDPVIFTGRMGVEELKHDRPALYESLVEKGELEQHLVPPADPTYLRTVRVFGMSALVIGFTLVALIVYGLIAGH